MSKLNEQYSQLTIDVTKSLTKKEKKDNGIFITPKSIIQKLFQQTISIIFENNLLLENILEPSCGTCEIVNYCDDKLSGVNIDGVEFNAKMYEAIKNVQFKNNVIIHNTDFIKYKPDKKYNLIIGNPPYFVCKKECVPKEYESYIYGRPNIFGLFILYTLSMLENNGLLSFVVTKSFLNSAYYSKIRNYIKETCIIHIIEDYTNLNDFIDTEQATFGLIIQKKEMLPSKIDCNYSLLLNGNYIFTDNCAVLKELFEGATTIDKLGLKVRTGQIVWNERKNVLTDEKTKTVLLYNANISNDNKIEIKNFKNEEKKQYINMEGKTESTFVVNRGNGNSAYKLSYAIVDNITYLVENHLNEIYSETKLDKVELLKKYEILTKSFKNPKTKKFIELFLGNNGLSKTELETIFPIYL